MNFTENGIRLNDEAVKYEPSRTRQSLRPE